MKIETVAVGMRSDGLVMLTLTATDDSGQSCETSFVMPNGLADLTGDDLKAAAERARVRLEALAKMKTAEEEKKP